MTDKTKKLTKKTSKVRKTILMTNKMIKDLEKKLTIYNITDLKWKFFYIFFSFLFSFILCVDSWEYLLNFEIAFLISEKINLQSFIFTKLTEGQNLIYLISFFYSTILTTIVCLIYLYIFISPALYKEELFKITLIFLSFGIFFILIFLLNHYLIFPILCQDLLQYKYSNLNDFVMNLRIEPFLSILNFIVLKFKILLLLNIINVFWHLLFLIGKSNNYLINLLINNRFLIFFIIFLLTFFFFETEVYLAFYIIFLNLICFEIILFLIFLYKKYKKQEIKNEKTVR